jgi:hypothetical protein
MTRKTSFQSPSISRHYLPLLKTTSNHLFDNERDVTTLDAHCKIDKTDTSSFDTHALLLAVNFTYFHGNTITHEIEASAPEQYYLNSIISRYPIPFHYHC